MKPVRGRPGPATGDTVYGLAFDLDAPYTAAFRRFQTTSLFLSYPVPPFTTLRGLLANALGLAWADPLWEELERVLLLNVAPLGPLQPQVHMVKLLKAVPRQDKEDSGLRFPSSPVFQEFYVRPRYRVYCGIAAGEAEAAREVALLRDALLDPARPLYLGQSDDLVDVRVVWDGWATRVEGERLWGLVPGQGVQAAGEWLRLPWAVAGREYPLVLSDLLLPDDPPVQAPGVPGYRFGHEVVPLFGWGEGDG